MDKGADDDVIGGAVEEAVIHRDIDVADAADLDVEGAVKGGDLDVRVGKVEEAAAKGIDIEVCLLIL